MRTNKEKLYNRMAADHIRRAIDLIRKNEAAHIKRLGHASAWSADYTHFRKQLEEFLSTDNGECGFDPFVKKVG